MIKVPLGEIATVRTAAIFRDAAPKESPDGNVHALAIKDLVGRWPLKVAGLPKINISGDLLHHCLSSGDVLIPSRGDHYQARYYDDISECVFAIGQVNIIQPRQGIIGRYLAWHLNQEETQRLIASMTTGTNIKALNKSTLVEMPIHVPPLVTQHQIADLLALWEQIQVRKEELIAVEQRQIGEICTSLFRKSSESK